MRAFRGVFAAIGGLVALVPALLLAAGPAQAAPRTIAEWGHGAGEVNNPVSVAVDQSGGELYVADRNNFRVLKFGPEGEFLLGWGFGVRDGKSAELQTCGPEADPATGRCFSVNLSSNPGAGNIAPDSVAVGPGGDVYVADIGWDRVTKFSPEGEFLFMVGKGVNQTEAANICTAADLEEGDLCGAGLEGAGPNEFTRPGSLALDPEGDLWVGDTDRLQEMHPDGTPGAGVELPATGQTGSLAIDSTGDFFTARRAVDERQRVSFEGFAPGDAFALDNLPEACSAAATDPIVFVEGAPGEANVLAALEAKCGADSFAATAVAGSPPAITLTFSGPLAQADQAPLGCATESGAGGCSAATLAHGRPTGVEKLQAATGALLERLDEGGDPRTVTVDGKDSVYVGDCGGGAGNNCPDYRFMVFNPAGEQVSQFGAGQAIGAPGEEQRSDAIAVDDSRGVLYAASVAVQAFDIPGPGPLIEDPRAEDRLPNAATLRASLNPEGYETDYHFELVSEAEYDEDKAKGGDGFQGAGVRKTPEGTLPAGFDAQGVEAPVNELIPGTTYRMRLVASNVEGKSQSEAAFTTRAAVGIEAQWASEVAARSATLNAELDPLGAEEAKWWVEYGVGDAFDRETEHRPLASDTGAVHVSVPVTGLVPGAAYRYRFLAEGKHDDVLYTAEGEPHGFATERAGLALTLPDRRAWEMVSPPEKLGGRITAFNAAHVQAAAGGDAVTYLSYGSLVAEQEGNRLLEGSSSLSRRGAGGEWSTEDLTPPHTVVTQLPTNSGFEYKLFSPELGRELMEPRDITPLSPEATERTPYVRHNTTPPAYEPLVTSPPALAGFGGDPEGPLGEVEVMGATPGLGRVLLRSFTALLPGAPAGALYLRDENGGLEVVSVAPADEGGGRLNAEPGGGEGSTLGALSADGRRVFFTPAPAGNALYLRDLDLGQSARLDVVQPGGFDVGAPDPLFLGASADGRVAFFTDTHQLSEESGEDGRDLYRCEVVVEAGAPVCELANLSGEAVVPGESSEALGLAAGMSEDGSRLFFVARGVLDTAPNGEEEVAVAGEPNLYAWHEGEGARFVARLSEADSRVWGTRTGDDLKAHWQSAAASPSGRYLAFTSERPLRGYDNRAAGGGERAQEVFRYDAAEDALICASCNPSGARPLARATEELSAEFDPQRAWAGEQGDDQVAAVLPEAARTQSAGYSLYRPRALHDNGRLFFNAVDSLVAADSNGEGDVYQYEPTGIGDCGAGSAGPAVSPHPDGGCIALISSGRAEGTAAFLDASVGGNDVFFYTPGRLAVTDEDDLLDVYDARVDGVQARLSEPVRCLGEACQPPAAAPDERTPASEAFAGAGNLAPGSRRRCARAARSAKRLSARAKRLRRAARRMARDQRRGKARRMRGKARRFARRAQRTSKSAKRCRQRVARRSRR